ncbi:MAG: LamG-like jellyroll fold domain-containing protein [Planctomycetota bacterium]
MKKSILIGLAVLLGMAGPAMGQLPWWFDSVTILPPAPTPADVVAITLAGTWGNSCVPDGLDVSMVGNDIYFGVFWTYPPTYCLQVVSSWELTECVGPLPVGTYTVHAMLDDEYRHRVSAYTPVAQFTVANRETFYVSAADGNDNNDGLTPETAFATIQKGIDTAEDADRLLVFPGMYAEELDFLGKAITVQSIDEPAVVTASDYYAVSFYHGEDADSVFKNFIVRDSNTAFLFFAASPTITNVTVVDCNFGALADGGANPDITNCIFWNNSDGDLFNCEARYSRMREPALGEGNIDADPLFADPNNGDFHLLSEYGRYMPKHRVRVLDEVTSPCIDGGDPSVNPGNEPVPNGDRINMGTYGGTSQASMSEWAAADEFYPANCAENICPGVTLTWPQAQDVIDHNIYLGTSLSDVNEGAVPVAEHWEPNSYTPSGLDLDTVYYWRVDGVNDANINSPWTGFVRWFSTNDGNAFDPYPADNQIAVPLDAVLTWSPGCIAESHDVYFSTDFSDVNERAPAAFQGNQLEPLFDPCGLEYCTRYYWRVDEIEDGDEWYGPVWTFRTQGPVPDPNLVLWYKFDESDGFIAASSSGCDLDGEVEGPESGWDPDGGLYGGCRAFNNDTAVSVPNGVLNDINDEITVYLWLNDAFQQDHNNWVLDTGFGDQNSPCRMQILFDGTAEQIVWRAGNDSCDVLVCDWNDIPQPRCWWPSDWHWFVFVKDENQHQMSIYANCALAAWRDGAENTLSNLCGAPFKIGGLTYDANDFTGKIDDFRIYDRAVSEGEIAMACCLFNPLALAWSPEPHDGEVNVPCDVNLTWKPGDYALQHNVFFGATWEDVNSMTDPCATKSLGDELYDPPGLLDFDTTYYWRVDEVNGPNTWKGCVWTFTTADYTVVDDFESYQAPPELLNCWYDQSSQPWGQTTGSWLSLPNSPVHTGSQAMEYWYDTDDPWADLSYAEAWRIFEGDCPGPQDWTQRGVRILTLFFYGGAGNDTGDTEQMYVGIEDTPGLYAEIRYGDYRGEDMNDLKIEEWQRWDIALQDFNDPAYAAVAADVDLSAIESLYIGFGNRRNPIPAGEGIVFFDDIRLYPPRCVPGPWMPDLNDDCVVDYEDLKIMALNWLKVGDLPGQFVGDDEINFRDFARFADHWLQDQLWPPN